MKIVVGTYDGGLMGWESDFSADPSGRTLQLTFAFAGHDGSVRCVALSEKAGGGNQSTLVSGGSDEIIRVFDLIKHKEVGSLLEHKAGVTAVDFFRTSHMLSGSQDGAVCVWRTADWLCLDNMRGHKAAVNSISIHPSGRLALSVAADRGLVMWDLTKGKPAYSTKLPGAANRVAWAATNPKDPSEASHFLVAYDACLAIHSGSSGKVIRVCGPGDNVLEAKEDPGKASALAGSIGAGVFGSSRICDLTLVLVPSSSSSSSSSSAASSSGSGSSSSSSSSSDSVLAVLGHEGGDVSVWSIPSGKLVRRFATGHSKRVRCVAFCDGLGVPGATAAAGGGAESGLSSAAADDLNPLSSLAAAAKGRVVLPSSSLTKEEAKAGFIVTADSEGSVKVWKASQVLSSSSSPSEEEAIEPLATLSAASGSRITSLTANRAAAGAVASSSSSSSASTGGAAAADVEIGSGGGASAGAGGKKKDKKEAEKKKQGKADDGGRKVGDKSKKRPQEGDDDDDEAAASAPRHPSHHQPKKQKKDHHHQQQGGGANSGPKVSFAVKVNKQREAGSGAAGAGAGAGGGGGGKPKKAVRFG